MISVIILGFCVVFLFVYFIVAIFGPPKKKYPMTITQILWLLWVLTILLRAELEKCSVGNLKSAARRVVF